MILMDNHSTYDGALEAQCETKNDLFEKE